MKKLLFIYFALCVCLAGYAQEAISEDQLYFTVTPSRTRVFEQEAVLLTYKFHVSDNMGLSIRLESKPDFQGVVSQEIALPENKPSHAETVNGRVQRAGVVRQTLVFPQHAGRITIPGLTFACEVRVGDMAVGAAIKLKRRVPDVVIDVESLPNPVPSAFKGAVGQFEIKESALPKTLKTGDIVTRSITIRGKGNLRLITPPHFDFPNNFETFDVTADDQVRVSDEGMDGSITFNYPFMPRVQGNHTLPADTFCYFDPQAREYRMVALVAQPLKVTQGARSSEDMNAEAELRRSDIRADHLLQGASRLKEWGVALWAVGVAFLFALFVLTNKILLRRSKAKAEWRGVAGANSRALKGLDKAAMLCDAGNSSAALSTLEMTLLDFAAEYIPKSNATDRNSLSELLISNGFSEKYVEKWQMLLTEIDKIRFAPVSTNDDETRALVQQATELLQHLSPAERLTPKS